MKLFNKNSHDKISQLHNKILQCRLCRELFGYEPNPIVMGCQNAKIMQISQAPSMSVHNSGKPFNDASGRRLRNDWYKISDEVFYNPNCFYITSMAHCFPGKGAGGGDRKPPKACLQWLEQELDSVDNEVFIIIGVYAAKHFFPKENFTKLVFKDVEINHKPAFILPHPSPLNVKWFMDNPNFEIERMPKVRTIVHSLLSLT